MEPLETMVKRQLMVVDATCVDSRWRNENADYIISQDQYLITVDIYKASQDDTVALNWLRRNSDFLLFDESMPHILDGHKLRTNRECGATPRTVKVSEIKAISGNNYYSMYYTEHLNIPSDARASVQMRAHAYPGNSYSLPLLRAVIIEHRLGENDILSFCSASSGDGFFYVTDRVSQRVFQYNFSNNPSVL